MNRPTIMWCALIPNNGHPERPVTVGGSLKECFNRYVAQEFAGDLTSAENARLKGEVRFARAEIVTVE